MMLAMLTDQPSMPALLRSRTKLAAAIAGEIKRARLTQHEAAERLGVSQSRISRVITGDVDKTSMGRLLQMLEALGAVVRITIRKPRDDERARIAIIDKLKEKSVPAPPNAEPLGGIDDQTALLRLLADTKRQLDRVQAELQFERDRIDELGGSAFEELMDAAILLNRARSGGDSEVEDTAREHVEAALEALLDQRQDIREADLD
jgi:predicted XRE-type DNA-binding protein